MAHRVKSYKIWFSPIYLALYAVSIGVLWLVFNVPLWAAVLLVALPGVRLRFTWEK